LIWGEKRKKERTKSAWAARRGKKKSGKEKRYKKRTGATRCRGNVGVAFGGKCGHIYGLRSERQREEKKAG